METRFKVLLDRQAFIWGNRIGKTIDIGTNDSSLIEHGHRILGIPFQKDADWLVRFDMDKWLLPNLVRGDAHRTPFKDNSFDTSVMGDILEHVVNPVAALSEADRITKTRIIFTVPNEYEWGESLKPFHNPNMSVQQQIDATLNHPSTYSKCVEFVPESKCHHLPHIRHFEFFSIAELLNKALANQYKVTVCNYYHELAPANETEAKDMPYIGVIVDKTVIVKDYREQQLKQHEVNT